MKYTTTLSVSLVAVLLAGAFISNAAAASLNDLKLYDATLTTSESISSGSSSPSLKADGFIAKGLVKNGHTVVATFEAEVSLTCMHTTGGKAPKTMYKTTSVPVSVELLTTKADRLNPTGKTNGYYWTATGDVSVPSAVEACNDNGNGWTPVGDDTVVSLALFTAKVVDAAGNPVFVDGQPLAVTKDFTA